MDSEKFDNIGYVGFFICVVILIIGLIGNTINCL
jgi:hypothetical protein